MKAILFSLMMVFSSGAMAKTLLLEVRTAGGFVRPDPDNCRSNELRIYDNGVIEQSKCDKLVKRIGRFSTEVIANLKESIAGVNTSALVDDHPSQPGCMDAPSTIYKVIQADKEIEIAGRINCKHYHQKEITTEGETLERLLGSLREISY